MISHIILNIEEILNLAVSDPRRNEVSHMVQTISHFTSNNDITQIMTFFKITTLFGQNELNRSICETQRSLIKGFIDLFQFKRRRCRGK